LASDAEFLDETIVVAYGTAKKESFTGSAGTVKSEGLQKRTVANVTKALDGMVAGITTTSGSGQPGDGATIQIRGTGSINASSDPLYVVDGIPFAGTLSSINPNDIESLTVLKDASAAALYGARAANGVIMITTKRGSEGQAVVNFKATVGLQSRSLKSYDTVNQDEFVELSWEALKNSYVINGGYSLESAKALASANLGASLGGEQYNPYKNYTWDNVIDPETGKLRADAVSAWNDNWMDVLTESKAIRQEYQLGVSGGNKKTKYAFSLGYLDDNGVLITTKFKRYSLRANVDHSVNDWMKLGANASYAYTFQNSSQYSSTQTGNAWYTAQFMAPIYPVYLKDADGNNVLDEFGKKQYDYGESGRPKAANFNVVGDLYDNHYETLRDNSGVRAYAILGGDNDAMGIFRGLSLSTNFGSDISNRNISSYYNPYHGDGKSTGGSITKYNTRTFSYTWNQILKYERTFDLVHVLGQVGHEYYNYQYKYLSADRTGVYPGIDELAPATNVAGNNSYSDVYRIESYFGRLAADYADKYYIEATWRTDGSSRFYKDNRWGQFWSLGGSWRVSQEAFMQNVSWVDNLTARLSYGELGNDSIGSYYAWQSFYDLTYANANNAGALVSSLANPEVSWEKKGSWNAGIEATLFRRLVNLTLEYYNSTTSDMLLSFPMATSTGFNGYNANVGSMRNTGFEGTLKLNWLNKTDVRASSTLMAYLNRNTVLKLTGESDTITSGAYVIKEGMPIYTFYVPKAAGVDPANGQMLYYAYESDEDGNMIEGTEYITSDKTAANKSKYYMGSREPKLQGSFGTDIQWKSIDFSFLTTFSLGGKVWDSLYASSMETTYAGDTWNRHILRRWQKPGDVTDVPAVLSNSGRLSADRWLVDASYFAIKSVQFGYTLPANWTGKVGIKSLRLFASGDNIALFSKIQGLNPQYNITGGTSWAYTPTRTFSLGVDINF
ncbi:MAG: SusC/RagA family TonB-linked outer membrane protein, partial [Bacteroidia bacterium]|nr:SusC/RagA family TonB-linked outer membrane protein [Bacteroidia bacterium]